MSQRPHCGVRACLVTKVTVADEFAEAFSKAQAAVASPLPNEGGAFISVNDRDKEKATQNARELHMLGFKIWATGGTHKYLSEHGIPSNKLYKVNEGRPNIADHIVNGDIQLVINTPLGQESRFDESAIRATALEHRLLCITNISGAAAAVEGIRAIQRDEAPVARIRQYQLESAE